MVRPWPVITRSCRSKADYLCLGGVVRVAPAEVYQKIKVERRTTEADLGS